MGGRLERGLRGALFCVLGLLLLTPFIVTPGTVSQFVVGKALWSRALIEVAFALWAVLALARPGHGPPRSRLLVLLAAGAGISLLAAWHGVSPQRSLWSNYERMQGVVDQLHWLALAVVLASLLRRAGEWRALLGAQLMAGTAVACAVIARACDIEVPLVGGYPEGHLPRLGGPLGNPAVLSIYLLLNLVLAAGFAAHAWTPSGEAGAHRLRGAAWGTVAALHLAGLVLAGSVGGLAGLLSATGFAALAFAVLARGRTRRAAVAVLAVLALVGAVFGPRFFDPGRATTLASGTLLGMPGGTGLDWMGRIHFQRPSVQGRLAAWETGLRGFAERPLLGWGPDNFEVVYGRHASGYATTDQVHDHAHGKLVELAATAGVAGVAAWLALWGSALAVLLGAARTLEPRERALAVFAAAALAGHLVQLQFLFDTAAGLLPATLLLAFAARFETKALPPGWRLRPPPGLAGRCRGLARRREARFALGAAAVGLALAGFGVNGAILDAAAARHAEPRSVSSQAVAHGIDAFPALANFYRNHLFEELARHWGEVRARDPARAAALLQWAEREAREAERTEPWNWRMAGNLARLYRAVAATEPGYVAEARRHLARARELAPNRAVFPVWLATPKGLATEPLADGRLVLRWLPSAHAGYHQIARAPALGDWDVVHYSYDPDRSAYTAAPCPGCRWRIKACRHPRTCTGWAEWPEPAAGAS